MVDSSIALAEFDVTYTGGGAAAARMRDSWTTLWSLLSLMAVGDSCAARPIVIMDDTSVLENRCSLPGHSLTGRQKLDGVLLTDEAVVAGGFLEAAMDAIGDYANAFEQEREDGPVVADLRSVAQAFADALPDSVREKPEAVIIAGDPRGAAPLLRFEGQATGRIHRKGPLADGPLGAVAVIDPPEAGRDSGRH
ncbi:hypothetical protein EBN03_01530 [Nocardia stercoris]|uniref:Uncharacterized protein n=1 Tax=Nocardia stercoris TaxID=2483361 RepID=A0A3M2LBX2_9NOCA|nr:hypothetical protein EBN03_01530 [Nocardia stercoris]